MTAVDQTRNKVQRILTSKLNRVEIDSDGDFVVRYQSAVAFVRVREGFGDGTMVDVRCPMVTGVKITNELCRWIATEGQDFKIGGTYLMEERDDDEQCWIFFRYSLTGDDLDESELMNAVGAIVATAQKLDNELQDKFGGELFGRE